MLGGSLFTRDFLTAGIRDTVAWKALGDQQVNAFATAARAAFTGFGPKPKPNQQEAVTEQQLIAPVLGALGWTHRLPQMSASRKGRSDVPDTMLLADAEALAAAQSAPAGDAWRHARSALEAKRWLRPLDRAETTGGEVPSSQMLRYLRTFSGLHGCPVRWAILTNGRLWRLYFDGARSVAEEHLEIDLAAALELPGFEPDLVDRMESVEPRHALKLFLLLFRPQAFAKGDDPRTLHEFARDEGRNFEARVRNQLGREIFETTFRELVAALAAADPARPAAPDVDYLHRVRDAGLIVLYRLLFLLYAEDRSLLPIGDRRYQPYSLRAQRDAIEIHEREGRGWSARQHRLWQACTDLFRTIDQGDADLGIPPYDGGLFDAGRPEASLLEGVRLPDTRFAGILDGLSRREEGGGKKRINYRDLSVRHLGSIYERLLEQEPVLDANGALVLRPNPRARKSSGSYYTPDSLVRLIIEETLRPVVDRARDAFRAKADGLRADPRDKARHRELLAPLDPAGRITALKVLDPAMGSGHFLVDLVDWLADETLAAIDEAEAMAAFCDYVPPLASLVETTRARIRQEADAGGWTVADDQLDDRQIVRRIVLKRCVYGVDKNPMAVELAKLSLWLHTFTVGAPLSFLDHHLRCGDSLFGEWVRPVMDKAGAEFGLQLNTDVQTARNQAVAMASLEAQADADVAEVRRSYDLFRGVLEGTERLSAFLGFWQALRWLKPTKDERAALKPFFDGAFGPPLGILTGKAVPKPPNGAEQTALLAEAPAQSRMLEQQARSRVDFDRAMTLMDKARTLAADERFLHWQVAFPGVWDRWDSAEPEGGFDAVIGNPPYVRQEQIKDLKPGLKESFPEAWHGMADLYVYFYAQGLRLLRPGGRLSYVVTNKWLRAGYAEPLRGLLAERAWLTRVVDFGHAKGFFPDADVFPSVVVVEKPSAGPAPETARISAIDRDDLREDDVQAQVTEDAFPLPRASFSRTAWVLEPPPVAALLAKIRARGVPLKDYAPAARRSTASRPAATRPS